MSDYSSTYTEGTGDTIDATDFSTEFDAIEIAIATKYDSDDLLDEDDMATNSATKFPSQQSTKAYVDTTVTGIRTKILDTPEVIVNTTSAANWTTFDMSAGGGNLAQSVTDGAVSLLLRAQVYGVSNTVTASVRNESAIFIAKSGKSGAPDLATDKAEKAAHIWWTKVITASTDEDHAAQVNDVMVNVDANGDFQYSTLENTSGGINSSTFTIYLVGYIY